MESVLLSRLRAIGHPHLTIFADAACATSTYKDQHKLIEQLGIRYRVVPVDLGNARRFHPKAFFVCDTERGILAVGSGNTTHGGWSANQEIWSTYSSQEEGGAALSSFREYLETILSFVPETQSIRENTINAFADETNVWTADLPAPAGLAFTPSSTTIIDQILTFTASEIESIDVLSPYFDPKADALTHISTLASNKVRVLLQPRHAGLSSDLVPGLPSTVELCSIEDASDERRHKFIHAKAYILKTGFGNIVCIGSANCSKAALMADSSWGNAELMALTHMTNDQVEDFLSGFLILDSPPELPEKHPSEDWKIETSELRILAARKEGSRLTVHFKSIKDPIRMVAISSDWSEELEALRLEPDKAHFLVDGPAEHIRLKAFYQDGAETLSSPAWIDNEDSLRTGGAERSIRGRLGDSAQGSLTGKDFLKILELFDLHIQQPISKGGGQKEKAERTSNAPAKFTEADIYADDFGKPSALFDPSMPIGFSVTDTLALFLSFFQMRGEKTPRTPPTPAQSDEDQEDADKEAPIARPDTYEENKAKFGVRVLRLLSKIEKALAKPKFITSRPASRLSSDISFVALLIVKARRDGYITPEEFRAHTFEIWRLLFFREKGAYGAIPTHIESLEAKDREAFVSELSDPRLSAAMALWSMMERENEDSDARLFRFAAASLASQYYWLSQGGTQEEITSALDQIASKLLTPEECEPLYDTWRNWVRDACAFEALKIALETKTQIELATLSSRNKFEAGEIIWQKGYGFCSLSAVCDKLTHKKAELLPINHSTPLKIMSTFVAPINDILNADIGVSEHVKAQIFSLINASS